MNQEILQQQGKLAVRKQEAERLRLLIMGHVRTIRSCLDPTETDPAKLRTNVAFETAFELEKTRTEYLAVMVEIAEINQYLGRG